MEIRFIEFMPLDAEGTWQREKVLFAHEILETLAREIMPLVEMVRVGVANRADVPIGLEVFNRALTELPFEERASRAKASLTELLASAVLD